MNQPRLLVISPVRDEAAFLAQTIESVAAQTVRPDLWIIVDDGSKDGSHRIVEQAMREHPWIRLVRRPDRGERRVGGGVIEAFNEGLSQVDLDRFDYVCKLDGDLRFGPTCFQKLLDKFQADPLLGTASGKCWERNGGAWVMLRTSDDFSLGACKFYRVPCFGQIGGLVAQVMWDGIDCHRCRMLGWKARSFHDPDLRVYELRPMGSSHKSIFHGRLRWGRGQYFMGTHPLYALALAGYRMFERPWLLGGLCILAGYLGGYLRRSGRYNDAEFRRYLRRWQLARLRLAPMPSPGQARSGAGGLGPATALTSDGTGRMGENHDDLILPERTSP
ncbi:MAG: glycosyltransferase family 2 protein [Phycisphaerae bacterium]|nr:glycosyltransferase family 2 protein [Phycisphaerae bacterium]